MNMAQGLQDLGVTSDSLPSQYRRRYIRPATWERISTARFMLDVEVDQPTDRPQVRERDAPHTRRH